VKVTTGSVWERKGAPELRVVVDGKLWWRVRFTYTVSGLHGITTVRKLQQQYRMVDASAAGDVASQT
jgi:hypothetical protein